MIEVLNKQSSFSNLKNIETNNVIILCPQPISFQLSINIVTPATNVIIAMVAKPIGEIIHLTKLTPKFTIPFIIEMPKKML